MAHPKKLQTNVPVKEAFRSMVKALTGIYPVREAGNMTTILFEDVFPEIKLHQTEQLTEKQQSKLLKIKERLLNHEPLQHVIGTTEFYGLRLKTDARALIPRPETEELVHLIIKDIRKKTHTGEGLSLLDIGTGTGCIPLTIKHHIQQLTVTGIDLSEKALALATENCDLLGLNAQFKVLDILDSKQWQQLPEFDLIVSNPPYIPESERPLMAQNVLNFEPRMALFVDNADPLLFYRVITEFALQKLKSGGALYFEVNEFNGAQLLEWMRSKPFVSCEGLEDMQGKVRMIRAVLS